MKPARSTYCGECRNDFESGEVVYFAWIENRSFCGNCHEKLKSKIADWETRYVPNRYSASVEEALERLKEELDMFGEYNRMLTVSRADLALIVKVMERGEEIG